MREPTERMDGMPPISLSHLKRPLWQRRFNIPNWKRNKNTRENAAHKIHQPQTSAVTNVWYHWALKKKLVEKNQRASSEKKND